MQKHIDDISASSRHCLKIAWDKLPGRGIVLMDPYVFFYMKSEKSLQFERLVQNLSKSKMVADLDLK